MLQHSFIKINQVNDVLYFKKLLDLSFYKKLLRGVMQKNKYIYYPELGVITNEYNTKEIYILKYKED